MRRFLPLILVLVGAGASGWGVHVLLLRSWGERGTARILAVDTGDATTEIRRQRRSASKATGYFRLEIEVRYAFDVPRTPAEALRPASADPVQRDVIGRDTLHYKVRDSEAEPVKAGDSLAVRYWRFLPSVNAAEQPRSTLVEGAVALGVGAVLLVVGMVVRPKAGKRPAQG